MHTNLPPREERSWWRDAVTYQIYIRSYADSDGDGIGDIKGIRSRLPYIKELGVDCIWINPWFQSPQKDHGYDVADYMAINKEYGTLDDAKALIKEAHDLGIRIILDLVPNHSSDLHEWFQAALKAKPGSKERERYIFRDGKGANGELPPNNWEAIFGGPAWERVPDGQWYLHLFAVEQPDFNWENPEVWQHFREIFRFWLDLEFDGLRIDVAHGMWKEKGLPDVDMAEVELLDRHYRPYWDQEEVHEIHRDWRKITNSYKHDPMLVSEAWAPTDQRTAMYVRPDELHQSFNFSFLTAKWEAKSLKQIIDKSMTEVVKVGAPPSWVWENHDVVRKTDRLELGLQNKGKGIEKFGDPKKLNKERALMRARAATLLELALPGGAYIYQGEELGLFEVRDLPENRLEDPIWKMSGHTDRGRDGCRVPIPWTKDAAGAHGFSADQSLTTDKAWLPQSAGWGERAVDTQKGVAGSFFELVKQALKIRKSEPGLGDGEMNWLDSTDDVIAFQRPGKFACYVNFGAADVVIPYGAEVLVASAPLKGEHIPTDTAVWLRLP
ncbi:MAG: glycoside hydrolase family 13 protein [Candidatus Nanopelagicaceae bacterium]